MLEPATGIIETKKGDSIRFIIAYDGAFTLLQINSNQFRNPDVWEDVKLSRRKYRRQPDTLALKKQRYIPYQKTGNIYEFQYAVTDESLYYVDILFDYTRVMRFKVVVKK